MFKRVLLILGLATSLVAIGLITAACGSSGQTTATTKPGEVAKSKLNATITKVDIATDGKVTVAYKLTDANGGPVTRSQLDANRERFSIARIAVNPDSKYTDWLSYVLADVKGTPYKLDGKDVQAALAQVTGVPVSAADSTGEYKEVRPGEYTYTFKTVLPADYDKNATTRVVYQATSDNRTTVANATFDFVPAGGAVKVTRQGVATENCNKCHDPLTAHGARRDTKLCVVCHTPQNVDPETGNVLDLKVMVHKIHRGANLPSVAAGKPYMIGGPTHDFSDVGFPQDVRNCTTCHSNAPNADNWKTNPSRAACGSCHDNIDWTTGKSTTAGKPDHAGGPQTSDATCKSCHVPDSGKEFDASIVGAHTIPVNSKELKGIVLNLKAASFKAGQAPTVDFSLKDKSGASLDPNTVDSVAITYAYPTTDYANRISETVNTVVSGNATPFKRLGMLTDQGGGVWRYTFSAAIDASWTKGSVGIGLQAYRNTVVKGAGNYGKDATVRDSAINPLLYVSLDGTTPVARRTVVNRDKCNSCHLDLGSPAGLSVHGGSRRNPQFCVECHNPTLTDEARHPKDQMPPESLEYDYMIHTIHMGSDRAKATNLNGGINTADILFPGNQADCLKCHDPGSYDLPLPAGVIAATIQQGGKPVNSGVVINGKAQPISLACAGCHAGQQGFEAHATSMTNAATGEACASCHGPGQVKDIAKVHAQ